MNALFQAHLPTLMRNNLMPSCERGFRREGVNDEPLPPTANRLQRLRKFEGKVDGQNLPMC